MTVSVHCASGKIILSSGYMWDEISKETFELETVARFTSQICFSPFILLLKTNRDGNSLERNETSFETLSSRRIIL